MELRGLGSVLARLEEPASGLGRIGVEETLGGYKGEVIVNRRGVENILQIGETRERAWRAAGNAKLLASEGEGRIYIL